jgi:tetratricopeptide (TPR) repeat protein
MPGLKPRFLALLLVVYILLASSSTDIRERVRNDALAARYDEAIADLTAAIEHAPYDPELYILRGQMYLYLYEWDRVLADYNAAIELDTAYADAYYYRGILYFTRNEPVLALADFQRYRALAPDGDHAEQAARSIADIQTQQQALNTKNP